MCGPLFVLLVNTSLLIDVSRALNRSFLLGFLGVFESMFTIMFLLYFLQTKPSSSLNDFSRFCFSSQISDPYLATGSFQTSISLVVFLCLRSVFLFFTAEEYLLNLRDMLVKHLNRAD